MAENAIVMNQASGQPRQGPSAIQCPLMKIRAVLSAEKAISARFESEHIEPIRKNRRNSATWEHCGAEGMDIHEAC